MRRNYPGNNAREIYRNNIISKTRTSGFKLSAKWMTRVWLWGTSSCNFRTPGIQRQNLKRKSSLCLTYQELEWYWIYHGNSGRWKTMSHAFKILGKIYFSLEFHILPNHQSRFTAELFADVQVFTNASPLFRCLESYWVCVQQNETANQKKGECQL